MEGRRGETHHNILTVLGYLRLSIESEEVLVCSNALISKVTSLPIPEKVFSLRKKIHGV